MRTLIVAMLIIMVAGTANAITLQQAKDEANVWVNTYKDDVFARVMECINEGNPRICHTAWIATTLPNTLPGAGALATVTFDDPGRRVENVCGTCYDPSRGTFAIAGIVTLPATGPVRLRIEIRNSPQGWGVVIIARFKRALTIYRRRFAYGFAQGSGWKEVIEP